MDTSQLRILHVDDDDDDLLLLSKALEEINLHHSITTASGCLDLFKLLENEDSYDLIIMDVNMPIMNGKQCLKKIKAHEKYCNIPVVMFTVSSAVSDIEETYQAGAHYHMVKPYAFVNLVESVRTLFAIDWKNNPPVPSKDHYVINHAFTQI